MVGLSVVSVDDVVFPLAVSPSSGDRGNTLSIFSRVSDFPSLSSISVLQQEHSIVHSA